MSAGSIEVLNVRDSGALLLVPGFASQWVAWEELEAAAWQRECPGTTYVVGPAYEDALERARAMQRARRIARCTQHGRYQSVIVAYTGPVGRDQNPAAHGGCCVLEGCRCGAERRVNVNGLHTETGEWT